MFIKADKYTNSLHGCEWPHYDGNERELKAPRGIQYRNKRYCLELARFLHPIEWQTYQLLDSTETPIFAKARNSYQRAADLRTKYDSLVDPVVLCLDHSRFDSHCTVPLLRIEHEYYQRHNDHPLLRQLLHWQLDNRGATKNGTTYFVPGTRMSGDMNTGLGNNVLNYGMLRAWLDRSGVKGYVYLDGDDSVILLERKDRARLLPVEEHFAGCGHETRYTQEEDEFERVEFCQCRPVFDGRAWRMVRNPFRMLARIAWTVNPIPCETFMLRLVRSIGLCELAVSNGMPVAQEVALAIIRAGKGRIWKGVDAYKRAAMERFGPTKVKAFPVSMEARDSFAKAWDIPVAKQLEFEKWASKMALATTRMQDHVRHADLAY